MLRSCATKCSIYLGIFATSISLLQSQAAVAQQVTTIADRDSTKTLIQLGLSAGVSFNSFNGQPQSGQQNGYTIGVSAFHEFYKNLGVQVELNWLQQGGQLISFKDDTRIGLPESFSTKNVRNSSVSLNGVEVPVLIRYSFPLKKAWFPAVYGGASYVYNANAVDHYQKTGSLLPGEDIIATVTDTETLSSQYKTSRANMIVGAVVQMPLFDRIKLSIDFRYLRGLSAARSNYSYMGKEGFGTDISSNSFISKVGIVMPLGRL